MLGGAVKPQPPWRVWAEEALQDGPPGGCRGAAGSSPWGPGAPQSQGAEGKGPDTPTCFSVGGRPVCPPVFEGPSGTRRRGGGGGRGQASDLEVGKKEPQPEGEGAVRGSGRASMGDGMALGAETRPQVPSCPAPFGLSQPPGGRVSGICVFGASVIERCSFQRGNRQEARWLRRAGIPKPQMFPGPDCLSCGGS